MNVAAAAAGMFCPVALDLLVSVKKDKTKQRKRCRAINITQAAAKEVLKGGGRQDLARKAQRQLHGEEGRVGVAVFKCCSGVTFCSRCNKETTGRS